MNTKSKEFGSALAVLRIIGVEAMHNLNSDTKKIRLAQNYKFFLIWEQFVSENSKWNFNLTKKKNVCVCVRFFPPIRHFKSIMDKMTREYHCQCNESFVCIPIVHNNITLIKRGIFWILSFLRANIIISIDVKNSFVVVNFQILKTPSCYYACYHATIFNEHVRVESNYCCWQFQELIEELSTYYLVKWRNYYLSKERWDE